MKKSINFFSRVLCALMLCAGLTFVGCTEDPLEGVEDIGQGGNENSGENGNENGGGNEDGGEDNGGQETPAPELSAELTLGQVTATTAAFTGQIIVPDSKQTPSMVVIYYSDAETFNVSSAQRAYTTKFDADLNFAINLSGLKHSTTYNYCMVADVKNEKIESEVLSFATSNVTFSDVTVTSDTFTAELTAVVSGLYDVDKELIKAGLVYSSTAGKVETGDGTKLTASEITPEGAVSFSLKNLSAGTKYYYCFSLLQDKEYSYSEVAEFTTLQHPYDLQQDLDFSSATDLSSSATANCYIVSDSGLYKFKTVKGNSNESVGSAVSASILWETFGTSETPAYFDLIKGFSYKDGYIAFQTTDTFKEGNAVIAAKDESGKILWSWHIWMTDQPEGQEYYNNAGVVMDRNLGATSATPGEVGTLGLIYQWGRKDPFLGSSSLSSSDVAKSTITWPSPAQSNATRGTIEYAVNNPTVYVTGNGINSDWYYTGAYSTDNTRWTATSKTVYDPCPAGWRVPEGGENGLWAKATGSDSYFSGYPFDATNKGMNFSGKFGSAETIWYPAAGYRSVGEGGLIQVGLRGYYWSASPWRYYEDYSGAYMLSTFSSGSVTPSDGEDRAVGQAIRCVQE